MHIIANVSQFFFVLNDVCTEFFFPFALAVCLPSYLLCLGWIRNSFECEFMLLVTNFYRFFTVRHVRVLGWFQ